jgi:hypothetical protein
MMRAVPVLRTYIRNKKKEMKRMNEYPSRILPNSPSFNFSSLVILRGNGGTDLASDLLEKFSGWMEWIPGND